MELFKYAPLSFLNKFLDFINICWIFGRIPEEWNESVVVPIYKKGNRKDCNNYRGISLLNSAYKIYAKIITNRLNTITEALLTEEQNGFRQNRSCIDGVFTLAQIIEKHREFNIPTHMAFIDYHKAFDTVNRTQLWETLVLIGIPQHLIYAIKSMYGNTKIKIKMNNIISSESKIINQGVKQGCPMSPTLFNIYINNVIKTWEAELTTHFKIDNLPLNTLLYADDQIILANSEDNLQRAIYALFQVAKHYNLEISINKTKVMAFEGKNHIRSKIVINNNSIEQVNAFNYLGCCLSYVNSRDVDTKLAKFQQLLGTIKLTLLKKVRPETILKFYKVMAIPTLLYGSETWALTLAQLRRIEAAEMRLLRPLAGYTLYDHKRNADIRKELNITAITDTISTYRNNWYEHVLRMPNNRLPQRVFNYNPGGKRDLGRPRKRWRDQLTT